MTEVTVVAVAHRALGRLLRLRIEEAPVLDLTPREAAILSRALAAVGEGRSTERTIFMSPIASDGDFTATVDGDGMTIGAIAIGTDDHRLSWPEVARLARTLAALSAE